MMPDDQVRTPVDDEDALGRGRRDHLLVEALRAGANNQQAAHMSGYAIATVQRRLTDPVFRRTVVDARKAVQERTLNALAGAGPIGVLALIEAARGVDSQGNVVPWTARIQAAKVLADYGAGNINRFNVDFSPAGEESEEEHELTARLNEYKERALAELKADRALIEAEAVEVARPAPRRRRA